MITIPRAARPALHSAAVSLTVLLGLVAVLAVGNPSRAWSLENPEGRVILRITGAIGESNDTGAATFDRAMLDAFEVTTIRTETPWTDGEVVFEGPLVRDILEAVGAQGSKVQAIAINDYMIEIPLEDFRNYPVILATHMNGEELTVRSKGPLWVIYPWSDYEELRQERFHQRSIWQLKELGVQ